jgi:hypothetical protein
LFTVSSWNSKRKTSAALLLLLLLLLLLAEELQGIKKKVLVGSCNFRIDFVYNSVSGNSKKKSSTA